MTGCECYPRAWQGTENPSLSYVCQPNAARSVAVSEHGKPSGVSEGDPPGGYVGEGVGA